MPAAATTLAFSPFAMDAVPAPAAGTGRFTLDGDPALETRLAEICRQVRDGVEALVPPGRLEGILLGGGYGRGEGGVRATAAGDEPYNDLEFYVLLRGSTVLNDRRYRARLAHLAHALGEVAGIEVEFKVLSAARLRREPVTMFSYDLVQRHRLVCGDPALAREWAHHLRAENIPPAEATRLLFNRCSGLLFARERLDRPGFSADDADFVERNLAKARLALGDVILTVAGRYHWSCRERHRRLRELALPDAPALGAIAAEHARGVDFKLHPHRSARTAAMLAGDLRHLSALACSVWLWLESRRLGVAFPTPGDYAGHPATKCPGQPALRNWLVTIRHLGWAQAGRRSALRYPRERLLRALPVLLWQPTLLANPRESRRLQRDLGAAAETRASLLAAYTRMWEIFR
jgi:hypothetical protein